MPVPFSSAIDASTRCCAVLGWPVRHSASPAMQNAAMAALGLNWRYLAFETPPDSLKAAITGAMHLGFIGLNLTLPHKVAALVIVDEVDETAKLLGAINTIRFELRTGEQWTPLHCADTKHPGPVRAKGFNTDAGAIVRVLESDLRLKVRGLRVVLLGAGGAARAAAIMLIKAGAGELYLVNRTQSKAYELAAELASVAPGIHVRVGYPVGSADVLINGTSLGMKADDPLPFNPDRFDLKQVSAVFDMVYRKHPTPLLELAMGAGCNTTNGLGMLLYQGAASLELWCGKPAPIEVMRAALLAHVQAS